MPAFAKTSENVISLGCHSKVYNDKRCRDFWNGHKIILHCGIGISLTKWTFPDFATNTNSFSCKTKSKLLLRLYRPQFWGLLSPPYLVCFSWQVSFLISCPHGHLIRHQRSHHHPTRRHSPPHLPHHFEENQSLPVHLLHQYHCLEEKLWQHHLVEQETCWKKKNILATLLFFKCLVSISMISSRPNTSSVDSNHTRNSGHQHSSFICTGDQEGAISNPAIKYLFPDCVVRMPSASSSGSFLNAFESFLLGDRTWSSITTKSCPRFMEGIPFGWGWSGAESATERPRIDLTRDDRTSKMVSV